MVLLGGGGIPMLAPRKLTAPPTEAINHSCAPFDLLFPLYLIGLLVAGAPQDGGRELAVPFLMPTGSNCITLCSSFSLSDYRKRSEFHPIDSISRYC